MDGAMMGAGPLWPAYSGFLRKPIQQLFRPANGDLIIELISLF
jgi:hypothetical protein